MDTGFATSDYQYDLPGELIAQEPPADRTASRLLVLDRKTGAVSHHVFPEIVSFLRKGDLLVLNDTRVIPARLIGVKRDTGAAVEVLLLKRREASHPSAVPAPSCQGKGDPSPDGLCAQGDGGDSPDEVCTQGKGCRAGCTWECLVKPGKKLRTGARVVFGTDQTRTERGQELSPEPEKIPTKSQAGPLLEAEIADVLPDGNRLVRFTWCSGQGEGSATYEAEENTARTGGEACTFHANNPAPVTFEEILDALGEMPLPPYIKQKLKDRDRYNTVYAKHDGSAAAPTAGLHFTPELLAEIGNAGVRIAYVTLHVGLGTFRPVKTDDVRDHHMHTEWCHIPEETVRLIRETKAAGNRVICVGTTSCRTLESRAAGRIAGQRDGSFETGAFEPSAGSFSGETDIFIYPGFDFKVMDGLITNFHLPESTLLMLVSAFAGRENVLAAYEEAVRERYRFFSFGDAMAIL